MCGWWVAFRAYPLGTLSRSRTLTALARSIVAPSGLTKMSIAVSSFTDAPCASRGRGPSMGKDGRPVVLHADDRPAQLLGLGHRLLRRGGVGELTLLVVVDDEEGEPRRLQHLDVHVGVPTGDHRQPTGLGVDVLRLARAQRQGAEHLVCPDNCAVLVLVG